MEKEKTSFKEKLVYMISAFMTNRSFRIGLVLLKLVICILVKAPFGAYFSLPSSFCIWEIAADEAKNNGDFESFDDSGKYDEIIMDFIIDLPNKLKKLIKKLKINNKTQNKNNINTKKIEKKDIPIKNLEELTKGSIIRDYSEISNVPRLNTEGSIIRSSKEIEEEKEGFVSLLAYVKMYQALEENKQERNSVPIPIIDNVSGQINMKK